MMRFIMSLIFCLLVFCLLMILSCRLPANDDSDASEINRENKIQLTTSSETYEMITEDELRKNIIKNNIYDNLLQMQYSINKLNGKNDIQSRNFDIFDVSMISDEAMPYYDALKYCYNLREDGADLGEWKLIKDEHFIGLKQDLYYSEMQNLNFWTIYGLFTPTPDDYTRKEFNPAALGYAICARFDVSKYQLLLER